MKIQKNAVEILSKLNLSTLEAKTYLTLSKYEDLTAAEISKLTQIARPDIYRVTAKLQEKGLVEKILQRPTRIKAVPIKVGLELLLKNMKNEYEMAKKETHELFQRLEQTKLKNENKLTTEKFVLIPKKEAIITKIKQAIDQAQENVNLILTCKRFNYGINNFKENLNEAWKRGVMFRCLLEKPKMNRIEEALQICRNSGMCQIRFLTNQPTVVMALYDKKSVFIFLDPREDVPSSPALWSNSQSLLAMANDYFNVLWICSNNPEINTFLRPHLNASL